MIREATGMSDCVYVASRTRGDCIHIVFIHDWKVIKIKGLSARFQVAHKKQSQLAFKSWMVSDLKNILVDRALADTRKRFFT